MKRVMPPRSHRPTEPKDPLIPCHRYDGIKEYDNPLPARWASWRAGSRPGPSPTRWPMPAAGASTW